MIVEEMQKNFEAVESDDVKITIKLVELSKKIFP